MSALTHPKPAAQGEDALRLAWQRYRLPSWPATFEETMLDGTRAQLVRMHARHLARPSPVPAAVPAANQRTCTAKVPRLFSPPPGYVDHKRAAAGDLDD